MKPSLVLLAGLLLGAAPAIGQAYQQRPYAPRQGQYSRENYARQEASRLLFGPRGIPALTRPADPWNYNRPRIYSARPNYYANPSRLYYR